MTIQEMLFMIRSRLKDLAVKVWSEPELISNLNAGIYDYISKVPAESVPTLIKEATFSGTYWNCATDYVKVLHVIIDHGVTPSGSTTSTTLTEQCKILDIDEEYYALYAPAWAGAWAKYTTIGDNHSIKMGPSAYSGTVTYIGLPSTIASASSTFPLGSEHEEPIMNFAIAQALSKTNAQEAATYMARYDQRIATEQGVKFPQRHKVEKADPQEGP